MKESNKFFIKKFCYWFICLLLLQIYVPYALAQSKTVVIPLFDSGPSAPKTKTISIPARSLTFNSPNPNISISTDIGLRWQPDSIYEAGFYLTRPRDWNQNSPIKIHIYFALGGTGAGTVNWQIKLNNYSPNSGEWVTDPAATDADEPLIFPSGPSLYRIYSQTWTLSASSFLSDSPLWEIFFRRGGDSNGETFNGNLFVLCVEIEYDALP